MTWPQAFAIFGVCIAFAVALHGLFRWLINDNEITKEIIKNSGKDTFKGDTDQ